MNFDTWEPVYEAILADFGYDRSADERARDLLRDLVAGRDTFDPGDLDVEDRTVAVVAPGPSLESDLAAAASADRVFAASTAAGRLREAGIDLDCVVTDLDKHSGAVVDLTGAGVPVVAHAHGDNVPALEAAIPDADASALVPTTQARPRPPVRNFGGFTDGDRAAFLADHLGAARLTFPGWDLDDPSVGPAKARKLAWAGRLLAWLECRRGDRFAVLDGRRGDLDADPFPP